MWRPDAGRLARVGRLSVPIAGGLLSQNVHNLIDVAIVGQLGAAAVAAIGLGSFAAFTAFAASMGLSSSVQAVVARREGEGEREGVGAALRAGALLALGIGIVGTAVCWPLVGPVFSVLTDDPEVAGPGGDYLRARLAAMTFVGLGYAARGFWNGVARPWLDLSTTVASHVLNALLTFGLVFGWGPLPELGVLGAGIGTAIATAFAAVLHLALLGAFASPWRAFRASVDLGALRAVGKLLVPSAIQHGLFALSFLVLLGILARIDTHAVAAGEVLVQVSLFTILPALGIGQAAASLVGQALGRDDADDAQRWGWDALFVGVVTLAVFGLPLLIFPDPVLSVFLPHEPATRAMAVPALRLVGAVAALDAAGLVLQYALLGAGDARRVAVVVIALQWGALLPLAFLVGPTLGFGVLGVWIVLVATRLAQSGIFSALWAGGRWARVRV